MNIFGFIYKLSIEMFSRSILEIVITVLISVIIIYGCQHIWNYLKDTYTKKKTKNVVDSQIQKYKRIIEEIQQCSLEQGSQLSPFLSEHEKQIMNDELMKLIY